MKRPVPSAALDACDACRTALGGHWRIRAGLRKQAIRIEAASAWSGLPPAKVPGRASRLTAESTPRCAAIITSRNGRSFDPLALVDRQKTPTQRSTRMPDTPRQRIFDSILATVGNTPIVRLNALAPARVNVFVKLEAFNPMGSVKDRLALGIIEDAERRGALRPGRR